MKIIKSYFISVFCLFLIILPNLQVFSFEIVKDGKPNATVVVGSDTTEEDVYAANEFIKYIKEISGVTLPLSSVRGEGNNIYIGEAEAVKAFIKGIDPSFDWDSLKTDGILIYYGNNNLVLAGDNSGTIYAVYTFLEENCGVRYLTPDEDYIPKSETIYSKGENNHPDFYTYTPKLISRESFFTLHNNYWDYDLKLKLNGQHNIIPKAYGGHVVLNGFVHSFRQLIAPEIYGKDHPEWFALVDGKRMNTPAYPIGQLCLSNQEMVNELIKNVLKKIEEHPDHKIFSCSQNDTENFCTCPDCVKLTEKYGHSGALLTVINQVADAVAEKYPDKYIETLAYQYTRHAPKGGIVPRDNVIIRLCSVENDCGHDFKHPNNADFWNNLQDWKKICKTLYVWDYVSDFINYLIPHPNIQVFQPNIQYMVENNVIAVFEEGDYHNENSVLNHYKRYILAKLLWDPYMNMEKETKIFFDAFYGPATEDMLKFNEAIKQPNLRTDTKILSHFDMYRDFFTVDDWVEILTDLENALSKTEKGTKYYDRVYTDLICSYVGFYRARKSVQLQVASQIKLRFNSYDEFRKEMLEKGPALGIVKFNENDFLELSEIAHPKYEKEGEKPKLCENLSDDDWVDIQERWISVGFPGAGYTEIKKDPKASNGKAMWMTPISAEWYIQQSLSSIYNDDTLKYGDVYVTYRVEPNKVPGDAFACGLYNREGIEISQIRMHSDDTPKRDYITKQVGIIDFQNTTSDTIIWFSGCGNKEYAKGMYVDRVFIILHR
ncbi:MAG: DUF4838 domain-containing protein [Abditibacteriota bacterium]|nr:DUF4838 domain-containing protein [Abditibacteriota bacterium]